VEISVNQVLELQFAVALVEWVLLPTSRLVAKFSKI
jgi:hypothetical protein